MSKKMKKALILNGSPRPNGNTSVLTKSCVLALQKKDWQVEQCNLYHLNIRGCVHCDACKKVVTKPGCILKDDGTQVLDKVVAADVIVIASPVYCWSVSGCLSTTLDRFYSLFKKKKSLIDGKKIIGIFTSGGNEFDGMELCVQMLKNLCEYGKANYHGVIYRVNYGLRQPQVSLAEVEEQIQKLVESLC